VHNPRLQGKLSARSHLLNPLRAQATANAFEARQTATACAEVAGTAARVLKGASTAPSAEHDRKYEHKEEPHEDDDEI